MKNRIDRRTLQSQRVQLDLQHKRVEELRAERDWLLTEIHHRVKNNLQTVISLLSAQSSYSDSEEAQAALRDSQYRMHALSLIHQKMYQEDDLSGINMHWYIQELIGHIRECFLTDGFIRFELHTEVIVLDPAQAVPLGLILNEAITNAIKFAFPNKRQGLIAISLALQYNKCNLTITSNGVALPEGYSSNGNDTFGLHLIRGLADQLEAVLKLDNNPGMSLSLQFELKNKTLIV